MGDGFHRKLTTTLEGKVALGRDEVATLARDVAGRTARIRLDPSPRMPPEKIEARAHQTFWGGTARGLIGSSPLVIALTDAGTDGRQETSLIVMFDVESIFGARDGFEAHLDPPMWRIASGFLPGFSAYERYLVELARALRAERAGAHLDITSE